MPMAMKESLETLQSEINTAMKPLVQQQKFKDAFAQIASPHDDKENYDPHAGPKK